MNIPHNPMDLSIPSPTEKEQSERQEKRRINCRDQAFLRCSETVLDDVGLDDVPYVCIVDHNRDDDAYGDGKESVHGLANSQFHQMSISLYVRKSHLADVESIEGDIHQWESLEEAVIDAVA